MSLITLLFLGRREGKRFEIANTEIRNFEACLKYASDFKQLHFIGFSSHRKLTRGGLTEI